MKTIVSACLLFASTLAIPATISPKEVREIAEEAYIYGFPMVDNYRIQHAYFIDSRNPEYKAPFNVLRNIARVYTPEDTAIQTPNSDTPYSMLGLDLRAEPMVLTIAPIEKQRYFSVQLIDAYTFNFDYIGSRTTGNAGGTYLIAGPHWKGAVPKGIKKLFRSETEFAFAGFRTQLFNPADIENVKKVQAGYKAEPLSSFLKQKAQATVPQIEFPQPLTAEEQKTSPQFFNILSFVLKHCPTHPSERALRARFSKIGVGTDQQIDFATLPEETKQAMIAGMADAQAKLAEFEKTKVATGEVTSGQLFGTRKFLKNNYLYRYAAAVLGIYGNSREEAMYPIYQVDASGKKLDGSKASYTLRFGPNELPPVNAFWSLTMYQLPSSLLVANPLNRYLINSPMLPELKRDADGGLTLYIQSTSPGPEKESNWLPAPNGPFTAILRLYWPKKAALEGKWKAPSLK